MADSIEPLNNDVHFPDPQELGAFFPNYSSFSFIAQGGMGAVYQAVQTSLDRKVAIKMIPRSLSGNEEFEAQFQTEAKAMAKLNHSNLIAIYDFGALEEYLFIVMEYVKGETLHHYSYGKALAQNEAVQIVQRICDALSHAHHNGVVHRDIKPANVFLDEEGGLKIGDFGLACGIEQSGEGILYGTPGYIAPEVLSRGVQDIDHRSDLYATGVILHQLLTGEIPEGIIQQPIQLRNCHFKVNAILRKALNQNPQSRYQTAEEFSKDLSKLEGVLSGQSQGLVNAQKASLQRENLQKTLQGERRQTSVSQKASSSIGGSLRLMRNLMVIAVLGGACYAMMKAIEHKKEKNAQIEQDQILANERKKAEQIRRNQIARQGLGKEGLPEQGKASEHSSAKNQIRTQKPPAQSQSSTSLEGKSQPAVSKKTDLALEVKEKKATFDGSLESLEEALLKGDYTTFPEGTISYGTSYYYYVERPMSWADSVRFAQRCGATLAVAQTASKVSRLAGLVPKDQRAWLGAGSSDRNQWSWLTGEKCEFQAFSTSRGNVISLNKFGLFKPMFGGEQQPFILEWNENKKTQKSSLIEAQLKRIANTTKEGTPLYPTGTFFSEGRSYLLVPKKASYSIAEHYAHKHQAKMAEVSDRDERLALEEVLFRVLSQGESCWISGGSFFQKSETGTWEEALNLSSRRYILLEWSEDAPMKVK